MPVIFIVFAMSVIGTLRVISRYPVKSMRGQVVDSAFVGYSGMYGDRIYAFKTPQAPTFFPYFTGRNKRQMLLYTPRFRFPEQAYQPCSWPEAEAYSIGVTPVYGDENQLVVDVETPTAQVFAIDDPALAAQLAGDGPALSLCRSDRALTDGRPLSLISSQTVQQLSEETQKPVDPRRFRANLQVEWSQAAGFYEDELIGRQLKLGDRVIVALVERDPRCAMITFDPDTGEADPALLQCLSARHQRRAGVYAAVLVEGMVNVGDDVELI